MPFFVNPHQIADTQKAKLYQTYTHAHIQATTFIKSITNISNPHPPHNYTITTNPQNSQTNLRIKQ